MVDPSKSNEGDWEVVVPPLPEDEAEERFNQWKKDLEAKGMPVRPEDVRRDRVHKGPGEGCFVRYLLRKNTV